MSEKKTKISRKQALIASSQKSKLSNNITFWSKLPKPFFVLAPMANVTDFAFRSMIVKYGKPDVIWTEFVSADGLNSTGKGKLLIDLKFSEKERPIVAQLFGSNPETMRKATALCAMFGFDGVDINMGCPDRSVEKQGGGAAMMKDAKKALAVLAAAREGWGKSTVAKLPISVKTRIGYNKVDFDWLRLLLRQNLPALTVHLRTRKEMSDVPAHWELMPEIIKIRDEIQADIDPKERTLIIGNGDVGSIADAIVKVKKFGCDGVMIGRGVFGKPWLFEEIGDFRGKRKTTKVGRERDEGEVIISVKKSDQKLVTFSGGERVMTSRIMTENHNEQKTPTERLKIMVEHAKLFEKTFKKIKNFAIMRKHFKAYVSGWDGAKELRIKLMETENATQVDRIVKKYFKDFAEVPPRY